MSSRSPQRNLDVLRADSSVPRDRLLPAISVNVTDQETLKSAFKDTSIVVSLVGIMHGSPEDFERIQWKGAENVARCAKEAGAKLIHFSAIGADVKSHIPYARTKAFGERAVFEVMPDATVVRPSLVFGPDDDFFNVSTFLFLF